MNINDKKKMIYEKINIINEGNSTIDIVTYIKNNKISYSKNKYGIIVNISILDDKHINNLYNIIDILLTDNKTSLNVSPKKIEIESATKMKREFKKINLSSHQIEILELI